MIEGLKVTVKGSELKDLCSRRSAHHRSRAKTYADQKESMEKNQIKGMNYSNGDPVRLLQEKMEQHESEAEELGFIEEHIVVSETYLLERNDLHKLGIIKNKY